MAERRDPEITAENLRFLKQPEIAGLSRQLVADLWDILKNRGQVNPNRGVVEFTHRDESGHIKIVLVSTPALDRLLVQKDHLMTGEDIAIIQTNYLGLGWDKRLSVQEAKLAVKQIDAELCANDQISPDGKRLRLSSAELLSTNKLIVAEIFTEEVFLYSMAAASPEAALRNFDEPEKLQVVSFRDGKATIERKTEAERTPRLSAIFDIGSAMDLLDLRQLGATDQEVVIANVIFMQTIDVHGLSAWEYDEAPDEVRRAIITETNDKLFSVLGRETFGRFFPTDPRLSE